ncbi:MAG: DUF6152 family protein [Maricaulaceae bacterium]|jgi:hypothetical protein
MRAIAAALVLVMAAGGAALGHHSFAVFYEATETISVTGVVTEFRFSNPHGSITIEAQNDAGEIEEWKAETTAPVILRRRGWDRDSITVGETITMVGWPAKDGANLIRLRSVTRADGSAVGGEFSYEDD